MRMGIDKASAQFLIQAALKGVNFTKTLMLGHQVMYLSPVRLEKLLDKYHFLPTSYNRSQIYEWFERPICYADPFLNLLGAQSISCIDASAYEGADIVQDMNLPIPSELHEQYNLVLEGGTLEHIFNFPNAIKSCMEMVRVGGHFISITPANNFTGHGFYQFSPELFFRIFGSNNGFKLEHVIILQHNTTHPWYEVTDPAIVHRRVELCNNVPTTLIIQATKTKSTSIFAQFPQQSDYVGAWNTPLEESRTSQPEKQKKMGRALDKRLAIKLSYYPTVLCNLILAKLNRKNIAEKSFGNRDIYTAIDH